MHIRQDLWYRGQKDKLGDIELQGRHKRTNEKLGEKNGPPPSIRKTKAKIVC